MKPTRQLLLYSLLRLGMFAVVFAVLMLLQLEPWVAAVAAAIIALCVSYIFFRGPRERLARSLASARATEATDDDADAENAAIDYEALRSERERGTEAEAEHERGQTR